MITKKKILIFIISLGLITAMSYIGYQAYLYVMDEISMRIKKSVAEGVSEGIGRTINPFKWFKKKK